MVKRSLTESFQSLPTSLDPAGGGTAPVVVHATVPRISLTPDDAAIAAGVSRTRIFEAIRTGKLVARGDGKATIIEVAELAHWVASLPRKRAQAPLQSVPA